MENIEQNPNPYLVKTEKNANYQVEFYFQVPRNVVEESAEVELKKIAKKVKVPGFRPGKAPINLIKANYYNNALSQAIDNIIDKSVENIFDNMDSVPIQKGKVNNLEFKENSDLTFSIKFFTRPLFKKEDFDGLKITKKTVKVENQEIEKVLDEIKMRNAVPRKVNDYPKEGDQILISYYPVDPQTKVRLIGKDESTEIVIFNKNLPNEFYKALLNMKPDMERIVEMKVNDYNLIKSIDNIGGKLTYSLKLKQVERMIPAEIDEKILELYGVRSIDELKEIIKKELIKDKEKEVETDIWKQVIKQVNKKESIEIAPEVLKSELDNYWDGLLKKNPDLAKLPDKDKEHLQSHIKEDIDFDLKKTFLIMGIIDLLGLKISDDDIEDFILKITDDASEQKKLRKVLAKGTKERNKYEEIILTKKALNWILENAKVEEEG